MTKTICVFIVDGDPSARSGLTRLMRKAGHDTRDFASVDDFLATYDPKAPGCLVLDVGTAGPSGDELVARLKAGGFALPIIVVTTDGDTEIQHKARKLKAVGLFRKPVDGTALLDAVNWALK
jgi:FixJ family two-component response regulator